MYRVAAAKPRRPVKQATHVDEARPGGGAIVNAVTEVVQYFLGTGGRDGVHRPFIASLWTSSPSPTSTNTRRITAVPRQSLHIVVHCGHNACADPRIAVLTRAYQTGQAGVSGPPKPDFHSRRLRQQVQRMPRCRTFRGIAEDTRNGLPPYPGASNAGCGKNPVK